MKLCIAVPYYGAAHALFFRCIQELIRTPPCPLALIDVIGDSLIPRGRNTLVWKFLETDAEALLFIIFTPQQVSRILSHDLDHFPCIGGLYAKKKPEPAWVLNTFAEGPHKSGPDGLLKVRFAGTGFMLVTRKILEEIAAKWPDRKYIADSDEEGDYRYDYFPIGPRNIIVPDCPEKKPGEERYLSEDWAFSELVRQLGYDVVVDTQIRLEHMGLVHFPIKPESVLSQEGARDLHIGRKTQEFLTNVPIFVSDPSPNTGNLARRLIDVDSLVTHIAPGNIITNGAAAPAPDPSNVVPPPLVPFSPEPAEGFPVSTSNTNAA